MSLVPLRLERFGGGQSPGKTGTVLAGLGLSLGPMGIEPNSDEKSRDPVGAGVESLPSRPVRAGVGLISRLTWQELERTDQSPDQCGSVPT